MENKISLRPNPNVSSYLSHFQIAQLNFDLFEQEERLSKRRRRHRVLLKKAS